MLVDVPGYGYAIADKKTQLKFGKMIEDYVATRKELKEVFMLMEHIEMGGTSQDMIEDYDLGSYGTYELDDLIEEYCYKFIEEYQNYLQGEI